MQNNNNYGTSWSTGNTQIDKKNYQMLELFPTPVYATQLPEQLSSVIPFLDAQPPNSGSDEANYGERSANSYILDEPECIEMKKHVLEHVKEYAENILLYEYDSYE